MKNDDALGVLETLRATPTAVRYLLLGVVINQLGAFVQTFLILYLTFKGVGIGAAGLCLVAYSVGSIFGTVLGGELTHRFGPRTTIALAMGASAPLVASIPWVSKPGMFGLLLVVVGLAGLATQAYRPAAAVLLSDLMPERYQVMAFSMMRIALNVGAAVAPLIAAGLILINWDLLYWLDGATALLYSLLAFALLPKQKGHAKEEPESADRSAYAVMIRDRKYLFYLAASALGMIMYTQSTTALPLQIVKDGYPTSLYSAVLAISSVTLIVFELKVTTYVVRIPVHVAGLLGHVVNAIGFVCYALSTVSGAFVLVGAVLAVTGAMISGPSMFAHPAKFPASVKARYVGTMHAVIGAASAIGPLFAVFLWTQLGGNSFWLMCAALVVTAGLLAKSGLNRQTDAIPEGIKTEGATA